MGNLKPVNPVSLIGQFGLCLRHFTLQILDLFLICLEMADLRGMYPQTPGIGPNKGDAKKKLEKHIRNGTSIIYRYL